jgi:hypothetical protein
MLQAKVAVILAVFLCASGGVATAQEVKTSKERLSRKAFDEQRVDNCRVPVELRGPLPRPDCAEASDASTASRQSERLSPQAQSR